MPVRGSGWYKRPHRVKYIDHKGKPRTLCFHSRHNADDAARSYAAAGFEVSAETVGPEFVDRAIARRADDA